MLETVLELVKIALALGIVGVAVWWTWRTDSNAATRIAELERERTDLENEKRARDAAEAKDIVAAGDAGRAEQFMRESFDPPDAVPGSTVAKKPSN